MCLMTLIGEKDLGSTERKGLPRGHTFSLVIVSSSLGLLSYSKQLIDY